MKGLLRLFFTFSVIPMLVAGCHKRQAPDIGGKKDAAPANETAKSNDAGGISAEKAAPAAENEKPAAEEKPAAATAQPRPLSVADTHDDLAVTDPDYEAWFKKYHLDLNDPKMLDADPDGDGYTNREEFLAGTDPLDPNSHPNTHADAGVHKTIHLKEYNEVQLPFVLKTVEGETAKIERLDEGKGKFEEVRAGQALRGSSYKVEKVQIRRGMDKEGNPVDASHVTLENSETHEKVTLVKDLPTRTSNTFAVLASGNGSQTITVRRGDTFTWPGEKNATYKVLDLGSDQVLLQQVENGKMWTVNKR